MDVMTNLRQYYSNSHNITKREDILNPFEVLERQTLEVENIVEKNKFLTILFFSQLYTHLHTCQKSHPCSQAAVRTREGETDWFEVKCGLIQGCVLSPLLFIIFMDNIMKRANQEENSIEELLFADELVLIAEYQIRLQEMVSNLDQQCKTYGMRISRDKTEVMVTSREPIQCDIELDGETLRQVEQFKYLGSIFVREGGCKEDVKTRCLKAAQVFYQLSPILGHKEISMITKTQIIKAVSTLTLLYQSENDPHQQRKTDVDNNRDEVSQKSCRKDQYGQDQK